MRFKDTPSPPPIHWPDKKINSRDPLLPGRKTDLVINLDSFCSFSFQYETAHFKFFSWFDWRVIPTPQLFSSIRIPNSIVACSTCQLDQIFQNKLTPSQPNLFNICFSGPFQLSNNAFLLQLELSRAVHGSKEDLLGCKNVAALFVTHRCTSFLWGFFFFLFYWKQLLAGQKFNREQWVLAAHSGSRELNGAKFFAALKERAGFYNSQFMRTRIYEGRLFNVFSSWFFFFNKQSPSCNG